MKYRKKPVVIEAVQFDGNVESILPLFDGTALPTSIDQDLIDPTLHIQTLEGTMQCRVGDWLIRGIKGELYPCKPDIFAATYEPA